MFVHHPLLQSGSHPPIDTYMDGCSAKEPGVGGGRENREPWCRKVVEADPGISAGQRGALREEQVPVRDGRIRAEDASAWCINRSELETY